MMVRDVDPTALETFQGKVVGDAAAALGVILAYMGDRLGLYRALAEQGPATSDEIAARTGLAERYVREWLSANAAGGYVTFDAATGKFSLSPEQELVLAAEGDPRCMQGFFQTVVSQYLDEPKVTEAFHTGSGIPWSDHHTCLFDGVERFLRPVYQSVLVESWLPALEGVVERLRSGGRVADVGCGHGSSVVLMAQAFPAATFHGFDGHAGSIDQARARARAAGVEHNTTFEVVTAKDYPGTGYDLVAVFDALHDMGDPVGAATHIRGSLKPDGVFMLVEPLAGDSLEENLHPMGQIYYALSTMVCTPASRSQEVGLALGAQAGEKRLTQILNEAGFGRVRRVAETPTNMVLEARV